MQVGAADPAVRDIDAHGARPYGGLRDVLDADVTSVVIACGLHLGSLLRLCCVLLTPPGASSRRGTGSAPRPSRARPRSTLRSGPSGRASWRATMPAGLPVRGTGAVGAENGAASASDRRCRAGRAATGCAGAVEGTTFTRERRFFPPHPDPPRPHHPGLPDPDPDRRQGPVGARRTQLRLKTSWRPWVSGSATANKAESVTIGSDRTEAWHIQRCGADGFAGGRWTTTLPS